MLNHPELVPVFMSLMFCAALAIIVYAGRPKPIRWPRERWFERLSFWAACNHLDFPNASAWAFAAANAGEWVFNAFTNHRLMDELEEVHGRLGRLLCEASGGQASKTNYSSDTMSMLVQTYQDRLHDDRTVDALATLPNWEFPWARVKLLCEYFEVSEHDVMERRAHIKQMEKLVAASQRKRERAVKNNAK